MARKKILKHQLFEELSNCFDGSVHPDWGQFFGHFERLVLELGCGKAELLLELARLNRQDAHVGVDIKGDRLSRAGKRANEKHFNNIALLRADILDLKTYFKANSVDEIWLTFPDPFPKKRHAKHRMTGKKFFDVYKYLLKKNGTVHLKTDDNELFEFALQQIEEYKDARIVEHINDLHASDLPQETKILTTYERKWLEQGAKIKYARFTFGK